MGKRNRGRKAGSIAFAAALSAAILAAPAAAQAGESEAAATHRSIALRGIVLLDQPAAFRAMGWPDVPADGIDASRIADLPPKAARSLLAPFLGQPVDAALIRRIRGVIQDYFTAINRPFVSVAAPAQVLDNGVVQMQVVVSRVGSVSVDGSHWFGADQYTGPMRVRPGSAIDRAQLDADIAWINRNRFRRATVVAAPGTQIGTTDLAIRTVESFPLGGSVGIDNTGTPATGLTRLNARLEWGNAFGRGDLATASFLTSPDFRRLRQYGLGYVAFLPWHATLSLQGNFSTSRPPKDFVFGNVGRTKIASLRYAGDLPALGTIRQQFSLGFDFKRTNTNLLFGGESIFTTTSEVDQLAVGYSLQRDDDAGQASIGVTVYASPGNLGSGNTNAAFAAQQAGAQARYAYVNLSAERITRLPVGMSLSLRGALQLSTGTLLPSEQLVFGGTFSVRGFQEQGATRDQGVLVESELRLHPIATGLFSGISPSLQDQITPFAFLDYGHGWNRHNPAGRLPMTLASIGPGLSWQIGRHASGRFTYGFPIVRHGQTGPMLGPQFGIQLGF